MIDSERFCCRIYQTHSKFMRKNHFLQKILSHRGSYRQVILRENS